MNLDQRTIAVSKISAAVACNALAALRLAITEALTLGLSPEEIREIQALAKDIQQQPISHAGHLVEQLLREPQKTSCKHDGHCNCGNHHA